MVDIFSNKNGLIYKDISCIILDKDGTITDSHFYWSEIIARRSKKLIHKFKLDNSLYDLIAESMGLDISTNKLLPEGPIALKSRSEVVKKLEITLKNNNIKIALNQISELNERILSKKKFPLTLGGEHSITPGCIKPFVKKFNKILILHFDAHADLRNSYNNQKFSHASAIRRCLDHKNVSLVSFGIRNISKEEVPYLKKNSNRIEIFWAKDKKKWNLKKFKRIISNKTVYLTFDVDGFDSSLMPATGTPEPGGLFWDETLEILKIAAKNSNIVGADINELAPIKGFNSYNFLVAKLAYKILSYKFLT